MVQTAIVTGASRGIGRAVCEALAARGIKVVAVARSASALESLAKSPNITAVAGDVCDAETAARALRAASEISGGESLDALVLNAGYMPDAAVPTLELCPLNGPMATALEVNAYAPLRWVQAALPALRTARGRILYVGTPLGLQLGAPGAAPYAASKAAAVALLRCTAAEERLRPAGSRVECVLAVAPGIVHTDMMAAYVGGLSRAFPGAPGARGLLRAKERLDAGESCVEGLPVAIRKPRDVAEPLALAAMRAPSSLSGEFLMFDSEAIRSLSW